MSVYRKIIKFLEIIFWQQSRLSNSVLYLFRCSLSPRIFFCYKYTFATINIFGSFLLFPIYVCSLTNKEDLKNVRDEFDDIDLVFQEKRLLSLEEEIQLLIKKVNDLSQKVDTMEKKFDDNIKIVEQRELEQNPKKKKKLFWIGEILFYGMLLCIILGALLIKSNSDGRPTSFAGYSMFTVLTGSMQSELPKGSFVITKYVEPETLKIGDDITYMANETTTITHRIITIIERYQDTGKRAFETKGIMNAKPDKNLVPASNVVGKVVFHSKFIGNMASFIGEHWIFIIFILAVIFMVGGVLKKIYTQEDKANNDKIKKKRRLKIKIRKKGVKK